MGSKEKNMDLTSIQGEAVLNDVLQDNSTDKVSEKNHLEKKSSAKTVSKKISGQTSLRWKLETCIFPMEKIKS